MSSQAFKAADEVSWKVMDGLVIVVHLDSGAYFSLNATASAIWQQVVEGKSMPEVAEAVAAEFDVGDNDLGADVAACVDEWLENGMIGQATQSE